MPDHHQSIELELLAIRCQLGEMSAFDELIARWHTPIWQYVRRMADGNELADELTQETWLRVLRGIPELREPGQVVPWMFGIARRVLADRLRQKYRQEALLENAYNDLRDGDEGEIAYDRSDEIANLLDKLDGLPLPTRELLTLYYLQELSVDEIGQVLGIPAGTVKSRLYHARLALKEAVMAKENTR